VSDPKKSDKSKADPGNPPDEQSKTDTGTTDQAYKPVGKVQVLGEAKRDGKTVRVLMDDKRVWKEVR